MNAESRDSLPLFLPHASSLGSGSRGLLAELVEEGILRKNLVTPKHTYQVTTRFQCDDQVGIFRCTVSCDGTELAHSPWEPVFANFAREFAAMGVNREVREEMARRALRAHLTMCSRVGKALDQHGGLVKRAGLPRFAVPVFAVTTLILGTLIAVWFLKPEILSWERVTKMFAAGGETEDGVGPGTEEREDQAEEKVAEPVEGVVEVVELVEDEPEVRQEVGQERLSPPAATLAQPQPVAPPDRRERRTGPRPVARRKARPVQQEPQPSAPLQEPAPIEARQAPREPTTRLLPEPYSQPSGGFWPLNSSITPPDYSRVRLQPGQGIYYRSNAHWVDVPPVLRSLRCVTTREASGETKQVISMTLTEPSRLVVLVDQQIQRRPAWLATFRQKSDTLTAVDPDRKGTLTYLVFERDYPAGFVELGKNTAATRIAKRLRTASRRSTLMYLVCFTKSAKAAVKR